MKNRNTNRKVLDTDSYFFPAIRDLGKTYFGVLIRQLSKCFVFVRTQNQG